MLSRGERVDALTGRLCQSPKAGGISGRTLRRWLQGWRRRAQALVESVIEGILRLSPGFDVTPYLPEQNRPRGWLRSVLSLGGILRNLILRTESVPLFVFFNSCYPVHMSL